MLWHIYWLIEFDWLIDWLIDLCIPQSNIFSLSIKQNALWCIPWVYLFFAGLVGWHTSYSRNSWRDRPKGTVWQRHRRCLTALEVSSCPEPYFNSQLTCFTIFSFFQLSLKHFSQIVFVDQQFEQPISGLTRKMTAVFFLVYFTSQLSHLSNSS